MSAQLNLVEGENREDDCPPKVPPRNASIAASTGTVSLHRYSRQPGHKLQSPTSKPPIPPMQSTVTVVNTPTKHQERAMPKSAPPVVKPKPAGYRTYDCLNDNEEQFPLPVPPRTGLDMPPPLPTQPIPHLLPHQKSHTAENLNTITTKQLVQPNRTIQGNNSTARADEGILSLADFVKHYSQSLPLKVQVEEGFCGNEERFIISTGDVYNFHFIKNEKVMSVQDAGGTHFSIPLNSSIQFGILYNPVGNTAQAVKGYSFKTVGELAKYDVPPRIIRATQAFDVSDSKSSIEAEEILIIKKIGRTAIKRKHYVKVLSLHSREEKTLYEDCEGNFLTDPGSVRLYLTDIVEFFGDCLPLKAMLFLNSDVTEDSVLHLVSEVISLTHISVMTSIIATTCWNGEHNSDVIPEVSGEDQIPVAIPIELEISVSILEAQSEDEELYYNTKELFDNFDPSKIRNISGPSTTANANRTLKKSVRTGYEYKGLEILKPSRIYDECDFGPDSNKEALEDVPQDPKLKPCIATTNQELATVLQRKTAGKISPRSTQSHSTLHQPPLKSASLDSAISSPKTLSTDQCAECPHETSRISISPNAHQSNSPKPVMSSVAPSVFTYGNLSTPDSGAGNEFEDKRQIYQLRSELSHAFSLIDDLISKYNVLENEVKLLKKHMPLHAEKQASEKTPYSAQVKRNMDELRSLDHEQILKVLEKMNLSRYLQIFINEQIDGEILSQCDENVLEHELDICNTIHRARLMKIITGKVSASEVLKG